MLFVGYSFVDHVVHNYYFGMVCGSVCRVGTVVVETVVVEMSWRMISSPSFLVLLLVPFLLFRVSLSCGFRYCWVFGRGWQLDFVFVMIEIEIDP